MPTAIQRLRALRRARYRCQHRDLAGLLCGRQAGLVDADLHAVCRDHV